MSQLPPGFVLADEEEKRRPSTASRLAEAGRSLAGFPFVSPRETMLGRLATGEQPRRLAGLTARGLLQGPSSLVGLPLDAATAAYNLATGQQLRQPSEAISQSLTQAGLPEPQNLAETGMMAAAGGLPEIRAQLANLLPKSLLNVPASFQGEQSMQDLLLAEARDAGYVVPPATVGRTTARESVSGKALTQQAAAARNQKITNRLAAQAIGLPTDKKLSPSAVQEVRQKAGTVYQKIKENRTFRADDDYLNDLSGLEPESAQIAADFPGLKMLQMKEVSDLAQGMMQDQFSAKGAIELIKRLRNDAKTNLSFAVADPTKKALGNAQVDAAEALESLMARELARQGDMSLAREFQDARRTIAKTYSVEQAMNPATGNVNARSLAAELRRRKPLTGELSLIARFGEAFPRAAEDLKASSVSALDAAVTGILGVGGAGMAAFAYPAARYAARQSLLGEGMQESLVRRPEPMRGGLLAPSIGAAGATQAPAREQIGLPAGFVLMDEEEEQRRIRSPLSRIVPQPAGR
jgi:hypothetical protein